MAWFIALICPLLLAQLDDVPEVPEAAHKLEPAEVAHNFLRAMMNAESGELAQLGTDPFTFDGRVVKGREKIESFWKRFMKRNSGELDDLASGEITIYKYTEAVEKFGSPPAKFSHLKLKRCRFAAISFNKRNGILLILFRNKKKAWQVTAVSD